MTVEFKPQTADFEGVVKMTIPGFKERLQIAKELDLGNASSPSFDSIAVAEKLYGTLEGRVQAVALTHTPSGSRFNSLDELGQSEEGSEVIKELQAVLSKGKPLGNG